MECEAPLSHTARMSDVVEVSGVKVLEDVEDGV
jgi:hypothetical protein